jgi:RHS repeat-associated protein
MTIRLLTTSLLGAMALSLAAHAQTTVGPISYGSGQTVTVLGPHTVTTSGTVTVSSGANVRFLATSSVTLNAGFSCSGSTFQATVDTTPPTVPTGFSTSNDTNVSFTVNWTASTDPMVDVTSYEVSYGGNSLGTFASNSANINSVPPNNTPLTPSTPYTFVVRATDALGNTSAWGTPYIAITKPFAAFLAPSLNNSTVGIDPATVILSAAAGGTDGTITKVEFYNGATLIGTTTTNSGQTYPYQFSWTNVPWGTYTITAKAYDSLGEIAVSAPATIKVDAPPVVSLTAPANNALVIAPAPVMLAASATDANDMITKVDFYQGTTLLGTATSAPYQFTWNNAPYGSYTLTAIATNSFGATTTSSPVTLIVDVPPVVSLTAPANSSTFTVPATITLSASASSPDGTISKVDFYDGATLVHTVTSAPYQYTWKYVATGNHTLTARATDNYGVSTTSSAVSVTVNTLRQSGGTAGLGNTLPAAWAALSAGDTSRTDAVGITTGSLSVDKSGTASYSIPLYSCPGTAGMEPKLSLNYSSSAGSGVLGFGWSLSGTSAITRGGQTLAIDGQIHGLDYSANDRYYLDGQRLIAINGADGGNGTEYRTEMDSFSRIVSYGSIGNGPAYFVVYTKAGLIMELGNTGDSVLVPQSAPNGTVLSWSVDKIFDTKGNYMKFTYSPNNGTGEQSLTRIDYTGNDAAGVQPYNSIQFSYEGRDDSSSGFIFGTLVSHTQRLKHISAYNGGSLVRDYMMDYIERPNTNRTILTDIVETGADGKAYPPLTFTYQDPSFGWQENDGWAPPVPIGQWVNLGGGAWDEPPQGTGFVDLNGDGRPDFVQNKDGASMAWINTPGQGWVAAPNYAPPLNLADDNYKADIFSPHLFTHFVDLNDDGLLDMIGQPGNGFGFTTTQEPFNYTKTVWHGGGRGGFTYSTQDPQTVMVQEVQSIAVAYTNTGSGWAQSDRWTLPAPPGLKAAIDYAMGRTNWTNMSAAGNGPTDSVIAAPISSKVTLTVKGQFIDLTGNGLQDFVGEVIISYLVQPPPPSRGGGIGLPAYTTHVTIPCAYMNLGPGNGDNSLGAGWQEAPQYQAPFDSEMGAVFMDVNGDGLPDQVQNWYGNASFFQGVALNTGSGWNVVCYNYGSGGSISNPLLPPVRLNTGTDGSTNAPIGTELADLNGDGLADIINRNVPGDPDDANVAYLNTGNGWVQAPGYSSSLPLSNAHRSCGSVILDTNADGYPNILQCYDNGNTNVVLLGTGKGWISPATTAYNLPICLANTNAGGTGVDFVDINGTGVLDEVQNWNNPSGGSPQRAVFNQSSPMADHLIKVTTGMGVSASIIYKPLTDSSVYTKGTGATYPEMDVIGPQYVVSEVDNDDGVGGQYAMTYNYTGMRSHALRGSEGFASMTMTDSRTGISTVTDFRQDYPFIGMPSYSATKQSSGAILTANTTTYADQGSYPNVHFPYASQVVEQSHELNTSFVSSTATSVTYDSYGNALTLDVQSLDASGLPNGYEKVTTSTYDNDTTNWFLGRLSRSSVTSYAAGTAPITRTSAFAYDGASGLLTQEVVEPGDPLSLTTTYSYDAFGNKISATTSGAGFASRATATAYDSRGQFPVSMTNSLGYQDTYVYDSRWGVMSSQTGPNGLTTTWGYDGMGRKIQENRPDGTTTNINYRWAGAGAPSGATYLIETETSGTPPMLACYDKMGRSIYAFSLNGGDFDGNLKIVGGQTQYDSMGRAYWTSLPFYYGDAPAEGSQVTAYDVLNRTLQQRSADEEVSGGFVYTTFEYDGLVTAVTNNAGQRTETTKNSQGQVLKAVTNVNAANAAERGETDYTYDAVGNVLTTTVINSGGSPVTTSFIYDLSGRKIQMTDPDMGTWHYAYDAAGELVSQTDAKGQTATMAYDQLGRLASRTEVEGSTTWNYDTAPRGGGVWLGKLASVTAPNHYSEFYDYDSLGRASVTTRNINTGTAAAPNIEQFTMGQQYDSVGRPTITTYNRVYQVVNVYNAFGFLKEVRQASASTGFVNDTTQNQLFWQADSYSIRGSINGLTYGNGVTEDSVVATTTGRIQGFGIGYDSGNNVASYGYWHDALGNLVLRNDDTTGRNETYTYDGLNRLTASTLSTNGSPLSTVSVGYDSLGNITSKSDVGAYTYGQNGAGPHAVTAAGGNSYHYDADGNMVSGSVMVSGAPVARTLAWTSFNQVKNITQGSHSSTFTFDADHQRATQITDHGSTVYVGTAFERVTNGSDVQYKFYIFTPAGRSVVRTLDAGTVTTRYLHQDALGSIVAVTDENGAVAERYAYDPWGKQAVLQPPASGLTSRATARGFTDHEMLSDLGLIHMNGRVYDPVLGRFLSADPNVDRPSDSQNYNRYSYLGNNPLGGTDPTGFHGLFGSILMIVAVVVISFVTAGLAVWAAAALVGQSGVTLGVAFGALVGQGATLTTFGAVVAGAAGGFASGFAGSLLNGGSIGDAFKAGLIGGLVGGITGGLANEIGGSHLGYFGKALAHGVVDGAASEAQGGQFRSGFEAGFFTAVVSAKLDPHLDNDYERVAAAAIVGGTASEIGGGKFANGATTAAFQEILNSLQHRWQPGDIKITNVDIKINSVHWSEDNESLLEKADAAIKTMGPIVKLSALAEGSPGEILKAVAIDKMFDTAEGDDPSETAILAGDIIRNRINNISPYTVNTSWTYKVYEGESPGIFGFFKQPVWSETHAEFTNVRVPGIYSTKDNAMDWAFVQLHMQYKDATDYWANEYYSQRKH